MGKVKFMLNGRETILEKMNIEELLAHFKISKKVAIVEYNLKILKEKDYARQMINDNDNIEIISFVEGG